MLKLKHWIGAIMPDRRAELSYMEVKALSEDMERARIEARRALRSYQSLRRNYQSSCDLYLTQCAMRRVANQHGGR
mgnify:CR=1 FL=1